MQPEKYEPDAHFAPVIPLPDIVETKTGEEDEEVSERSLYDQGKCSQTKFTSRAKIFRFVKESNEYKEKGVGDIKVICSLLPAGRFKSIVSQVLYNAETKKTRVVMRRDQVREVHLFHGPGILSRRIVD